jgi:plasmid replication initiation protein
MGDNGQIDLFEVSAVDPPWRDNKDAMGYPFLSLQKRRTTAIRYSDADVWLMVSAPAEFGIATIWDWDVMIFAASHINEAIENRRKISSRITFVPHDCLKQIGRPICGKSYQALADAIRRLHATMVITDIREADQPEKGEEQGFHWVEGYRLPKKYGRRVYTTPDNITHITPEDPKGEADPARPWVIRIHPWLYNAIVSQGDILAVHPDYFRLTGGLERWLYRLARKAVPDKAEPPAIRFKMETLHARSGVTRDLKRFAFDIRALAEAQPLPEYGVQVEYRKGRRELVTLYRDTAKPCRPPRGRRLKTIRGENVEAAVNVDAYLVERKPFVIEPRSEAPVIELKPDPGELTADIAFPDGTRVWIKHSSSADPEAALRQVQLYLQQLRGKE